MDQVWADGPATVRAVLDGVNRTGARKRAYTTVLTVLGRLEEKGFVCRERIGRGDVYRAAVGRETWLRERSSADVRDLLDNYGDVALAHFADHLEGLDEERRAKLRKLIGDD
jgi:predicted transcriptional regulator